MAEGIEGSRYGRLTVIRRTDDGRGIHGAMWLCKCDCGNEKIIRRSSIMCGTRSCGCLIREAARKRGERVRKERGGDWLPGMPYGVPVALTHWPAPPAEAA